MSGVPDGLRVRAIADPHRPGFHFTSPAAWLNDPNGLCERDDGFHLFYQYNPAAPRHGDIHWGHALSVDLVHWLDRPVALEPSPGPDSGGCWSGVLVETPEGPALVYSGHDPQSLPTQTCCVARPACPVGVDRWAKDPANPVVAGPPTGLDVLQMRDHCVWCDEEGQWHQVMGAGLRGRGGALLHYTSPDLREWTFVGTMLVDDERTAGGAFVGTTWECPDVFALPGASGVGGSGAAAGGAPGAGPGPASGEGGDVFVFSAWDEGRTVQSVYLTGTRAEGRFVPDAPARVLDLGLRHYYAPQSFLARDGRRLQFGWMQEARPQEALDAAGWSGAMSLPRVLGRGPDGGIVAAPAREVDALRVGVPELSRVDEGDAVTLATRGAQLDLEALVVLGEGGVFELDVLATPDGAERTRVVLEHRPGSDGAWLRLDRSISRVPALAEGYDERPLGGAVALGGGGGVRLRVIVDHSVVEVFANGRPLTARVYPSRGDATGVRVGVSGSGTRVEDVRVWAMARAEQEERSMFPHSSAQ